MTLAESTFSIESCEVPDTCKEAAHYWYERGYRVVPIDPDTKHSRVKWKGWLYRLARDGHAAIDDEWRDTDQVGAIVDDSLFILDADRPEALAAMAALEKSFEVSPNLVVDTKCGEHHYYRKSPDTYAHASSFSSKNSPEKIDIRTGRGAEEGRSVIVLPPSTGKVVLLNEATSIADLTEVDQAFIDAVFRHNGKQPPRPAPPAKAEETRRVVGQSEAAEILSYIPADCDYEDWLTVLFGTHSKYSGSDDGLYLLDTWSADAVNYAGFEEIEYKYRAMNPDGAVTWNSVCKLAETHGADLSMIARSYDADGNKRRGFDLILTDAQNLDADSMPDAIEALVIESEHLKPAERRRVYEAIKRQTSMPLTVLHEILKEHQSEARASYGEPDELSLARGVIEQVGAENILSAIASVWLWDQAGLWRQLDDRTVKKIVQAKIPGEVDSVSSGLVSGVTDLMRTEIHKPFHKFNLGNPESVNCLNGELMLSDGQWVLTPHCREHYRTTQIPVAYDPEADAPQFRRFLAQIFQGDPDAAEKTQALLETMGYTLMAHCNHEKFVILVGSGANGKSVLLVVLEALCGSESTAGVQPSQFDNKFQRAHLHMKLANIVTEIKQGEVIDDASLKGIVSGEPTTVEHKHKDPFVMRPFATCWFGTNHMPHTRDFSDALFRRALVIPFNQVFKPELGNCDPHLKDKLLTELPGILNMALDAYAQALMHGFTTPSSAEEARLDWRLEADQVAQFVEECCEANPFGGGVAASVLYSAYDRWANDNGIHKRVTMKSFRDRMTRLGYGSQRTKKARMVTGIEIVNRATSPTSWGDG